LQTPNSSLPATTPHNPGDHVATSDEEVFTAEELHKFNRIINLANLAVVCLKDQSSASAEAKNALKIMQEAGVYKPDMTAKEGRRAIGALWKTVDDLMAGNGTTSEGFNLIHRLLLLTNQSA